MRKNRVGAGIALATSLATFAALLLAAPASSQSSCTITWTGHASNHLWGEPGNWEPSRAPEARDNVCIPASNTVEISQEVVSVSTLSSQGRLIVPSGAGLRTTDPEESSTVSTLVQSGGLVEGRSPLVVGSSFEWSGGEEGEGVTEVVSGGRLSLRQGTEYLRAGRVLKVDKGASAGMAVGADLYVSEEASVENAGSFEVAVGESVSGEIVDDGGAGGFVNAGVFASSGAGSFSVEVPFDDEGTVDVSGGVLRLEGGGSEGASAVFSVSGSGGLLSFAGGSFGLASGLSFSGKVSQSGGKLDGALVVKGGFEWSGGEEGEGVTEVVSGGRLATGAGTEVLGTGRVLKTDAGASTTMEPGSDLVVGENAAVKNAGLFEVEGDEEEKSRISYGGSGGVFRNSGTFTRSQGGETFVVEVPFDDEGTVDVSGGALRLEGGGSEGASAVFSVSGSGGLLSFAGGTFGLASGLSFSGRVAQSGGKLKGSLIVGGSFEWTGGEEGEGVTEVVSGGRLSLRQGTEYLQAGRLLEVDAGASTMMGPGSDLVVGENAAVKNAGSFEVEGDEEEGSRISYGGSGGVFRNSGTFIRSEGGGVFPVDVLLDNEGIVDVKTGVLSTSAFVQSAHGVLALHIAGALLGIGFTQLDVEGTATLEGTLRVSTENGFHPERGQHFEVLAAATLTGTFALLEEVGSIGGGWSYTTAYGASGIEVVVAGGPVPTSTTASLAGGGQSGGAITVPEDTVVTASALLGGANASTATGDISYRVYSDPTCSDEVANAGTVVVGPGGAVAGSNQEVFSAGTYYWQATYSGDSTNQRSNTVCGAAVETVEAPAKAASGGVLSSIEALPPPVSGRTANLAPVSGEVEVQVPGSRRFTKLSTAKSVPEGTLINTSEGFVALCRASKEGDKQCAEFNGGEFRIEEKKNAPAAVLALEGGDFAGCPTSRKDAAAVASSHGGGKPTRKLWGSGHGHFTTDGRNSATTVRGTIWSVEDRCAATVTTVMRGVVSVYDYRLHRAFQVSAGHSYIAKAR
jgi:hypothetical protein